MTGTLRDVALRAGVSVSTASRVLSGSSHPVAADARARVLRAAEELGFTPNAFARGLSKREFRLIGLVIPDIRDPYFVEIARGAEELANQRGYLIILCNTNRQPEKERSYVHTLRAMRAGIILTGGGIDREAHLQDLATHPAPVVVIGRHELPCSSVLIDNLQGAIDATTHLIGLGRRRIAFICGPSNSATAADRLVGFRRAMEENGLAIDEDLVVDGDFSLEGGARAARALLQQGHAPDAVFASNDQMALGVIREARHQGIRIPEELAVVGFNGIMAAAEADPPLTTIHLSLGRIGQIATELLLKQVETKEEQQVAVTIRGELVVAGSTVPQCKERHCVARI